MDNPKPKRRKELVLSGVRDMKSSKNDFIKTKSLETGNHVY